MATIVFSHANSFPSGTYGVLFQSLRLRGFDVRAVECFGHDPRYPVSSNWPHLVGQLADFAKAIVDTQDGAPVFLAGHSLGGFLSAMCAARHPQLARGVLLLDAPLLGGWRAATLGMAKRTQLVGAVSPGRISRKRRNTWPDAEAALEHFRRKKPFARWDARVLADYIAHGTRTDPASGQRVLVFQREIETAIYDGLPHNLDRLLRAHPPRCPMAYIGGLQSEEMHRIGMALTRKVTHGRVSMLDGSHLFPMEKPEATAAAMEAALRGLGA